jgi:OOP family OmpA-OmpF porin
MTKHLLAAFGLLAAFFAAPASAQLDASALYIGGSLGRAHWTDACTPGLTTCKDRDTEWNFFGGLQFNRYIAVEAGYRDFGHIDLDDTSFKANALEATLVGSLPLRGGLGIIGRIGAYNGKIRGGGIEEKTTNPTFGWGVYYDVTPQAGFRLEYQRYSKMGGGDFGRETHVDSVALGGVLRFR